MLTHRRTASRIAVALLPFLVCFVDSLSIPRSMRIVTTTPAPPHEHNSAGHPTHTFKETTRLPISTTDILTRRSILKNASLVSSSFISLAIIGDALSALAVDDAQFVEVGQQERPPNGETPFTTLPNGVQIKDFRVGGGGATSGSLAVVQVGSRVELTMKGRLLNLNGVIFYDTKENDPNGFGEGSPLVFTVGDNTVLPGLESGIIGMTKGGVRRIIVPANLGYGAFPTLEPQPLSEMEKRALESVTKNSRRDQTVLFDVWVDRVR